MAQLEPTRRSVIRAGVWSAPVIVAASAAPAHASSPLPPLTWTWTARYVSSSQADTYVTVVNNTDAAVDVVLTAPRQPGPNIELYGYGFADGWDGSTTADQLRLSVTVAPGQSSVSPLIGYYARQVPASAVVTGTLTPEASPPTPFVSLEFT